MAEKLTRWRPSKRSRHWPIKEDAGPWLIWSFKWNCWHLRSETGGACGYTDDILQAGVFDLGKAREYHDTPPHRSDVAVPASKMIAEMKLRLAGRAAELTRAIANVQRANRGAALQSKDTQHD